MNLFIILSCINIVVSFVVSVIVYNLLKNYTDLGKNRVSCSFYPKKFFRSLTSFYMMDITYNGISISQVISKNDYNKLYRMKECDVYIRKYSKKYLNPNLSLYEFSIDKPNWNKKDLSSSIKGAIYLSLVFEFFIYVFIFMP